jgi:ketosteroid isomerase-like protein
MNQLLFIPFFLLAFLNGKAQKGIGSLVAAERSFASYSVQHGTKEAFLTYLDSNGIVFEGGQPVNGIVSWQKKEKRPGILDWSPEAAGISQSEDFGYTTGSWTFRRNATDTVIARGRYTTVWHLNQKGEWKFLVDLGVGNTPAPGNLDTVYSLISEKGTKSNARELGQAESTFLATFRKSPLTAYKHFLAPKGIINRNNRLPVSSDSIAIMLREMPGNILFIPGTPVIADSGDLGFIYGNTLINGKPENYLRIWMREANGWKIAVEVVRY